MARLAQSVEHETLNLGVVGSSPTLGGFFLFSFSNSEENSKKANIKKQAKTEIEKYLLMNKDQMFKNYSYDFY
jgi:hypothetical protein